MRRRRTHITIDIIQRQLRSRHALNNQARAFLGERTLARARAFIQTMKVSHLLLCGDITLTFICVYTHRTWPLLSRVCNYVVCNELYAAAVPSRRHLFIGKRWLQFSRNPLRSLSWMYYVSSLCFNKSCLYMHQN